MRLQYEAVSVRMCLSVQLIDWWLIQGHVSEVFGRDHLGPVITDSPSSGNLKHCWIQSSFLTTDHTSPLSLVLFQSVIM